MIEAVLIHCPYCGECFESRADTSAGSQQYVEDCAVCCRPIELHLRVGDDGALLGIDARTDRD